ncbi:MAG: hypothetical protein FWC07_10485 [Defluviitaleaceae bacterium]|nr:hypothetical protein [Defluviitaleaceae bacterium]
MNDNAHEQRYFSYFMGYIYAQTVKKLLTNINDEGAGALEYFKTSPEYCKKGILLPFYQHAIKYAFENGMRFVIGYRYMDWDIDTSNGYSLYDELGFPRLY